MLWELRVSELRYRAVLEVLDGATVTSVARRFGVSRGTAHAWLGRYAAAGGVVNLRDRSSRPHSCPHQMSPVVEARVLAMRDAHPGWGPDRIVYQLGRAGVDPVPGRSGVYRALAHMGGLVVKGQDGVSSVGVTGGLDAAVCDAWGQRVWVSVSVRRDVKADMRGLGTPQDRYAAAGWETRR